MSNNLLKNKKGIIFGALDDNSIAWKTAQKVHSQGGKFVLTNAPVALRMGKISELAKETNSLLVEADATKNEPIWLRHVDVAETESVLVHILYWRLGR